MTDDIEHSNSRKVSDRSEAASPAKRRLLSGLGAGGGVLGISALVPATWVKPVVNAVVLPVHAVHSPGHPESPPVTDPESPPVTDPESPPVTGPVTNASVTYAVESGGPIVRSQWTAAPGAVIRYDIRYNTTGTPFSGDPRPLSSTSTSHSTFADIETLATGQRYHAEITAVYAEGVTHTVVAQTAVYTLTGPVTNASVTYEIGETEPIVRSRWTAAPGAVLRYDIRYNTTGTPFSGQLYAVSSELTDHGTFDNLENLTTGQRYHAEITAVYAEGVTHVVAVQTAVYTEPEVGPVGPVTNASATYGVNVNGPFVRTQWTAAPGAVTSYRLRFNLTGAPFARGHYLALSSSSSGTRSFANITTLTTGQRYHVEIETHYAQGVTRTVVVQTAVQQ